MNCSPRGSCFVGEAVSVVRHSLKGLILLAMRDFAPGDLLSSVVCYVVPPSDVFDLAKTDFYKFVFYQPNDVHSQDRTGYVAFGPVSYCSHSSVPNSRVEWVKVGDLNVIELRALVPIDEGHEVTIRYSNIEEYVGHEGWT